MIFADSPQRAVLTNAKHPNGSTLYPCPYCWVKQSGEHDCPVGRHDFDIAGENRTRKDYERAFARLEPQPPGSKEQTDLSRDIGVVPKRGGTAHPMYDLLRAGEILRRIPPEALHADALVSTPVQIIAHTADIIDRSRGAKYSTPASAAAWYVTHRCGVLRTAICASGVP